MKSRLIYSLITILILSSCGQIFSMHRPAFAQAYNARMAQRAQQAEQRRAAAEMRGQNNANGRLPDRPIAAEQAVVAAGPVANVQPMVQADDECPYCLEAARDVNIDQVHVTQCCNNHFICRDHAIAMRERGQGCPICRQPLVTIPAGIQEEPEPNAPIQQPNVIQMQDLPEADEAIQQHECAICFDDKGLQDFVWLSCGHEYCVDCLGRLLDIAIQERSTAQLKCPECNNKLEERDVKEITNDMAKIAAYSDIATQEWIATQQAAKHCPSPNCNYVFINDDQIREIKCPSCNHEYCASCLLPHQLDITCAEARNARTAEEIENERWNAINTRPCPGCNVRIEKNGGCKYMTCGHCKQPLCWDCGIVLRQSHEDHPCIPVTRPVVAQGGGNQPMDIPPARPLPVPPNRPPARPFHMPPGANIPRNVPIAQQLPIPAAMQANGQGQQAINNNIINNIRVFPQQGHLRRDYTQEQLEGVIQNYRMRLRFDRDGRVDFARILQVAHAYRDIEIEALEYLYREYNRPDRNAEAVNVNQPRIYLYHMIRYNQGGGHHATPAHIRVCLRVDRDLPDMDTFFNNLFHFVARRRFTENIMKNGNGNNRWIEFHTTMSFDEIQELIYEANQQQFN